MTDDKLVFAQLHADLSNDLDRICERFTGAVKISLVVRTGDGPDQSLYLTNDDTEKVIGAILQREEKSKFVFQKARA